jgi:cyclic pyranopterin phosphate synthase
MPMSLPIAACAHQRLARHARPRKFRKITRWGDLDKVMEGIDAAQKAGLQDQDQRRRAEGFQRRRNARDDEWAHGRGMDLTLIETMPMGEIEEDRTDQYLPLSQAARTP